MKVTRRRFLALTGAAGVGLFAGATVYGGCAGPGSQTGRLLASARPLPPRFAVPLAVPPVARAGPDGVIELVQREADAEILPEVRTRVWGYDGRFPGPTVVSERDRELTVRIRNSLPAPTATHLHGGHTPAGSDGYPTDLVLPAGWEAEPGMVCSLGVKDYVYPLRQRAATLWYHDHRMDFTGPQVWRGLAGFHLVSDAGERALPLPDGERDVPLMLCDRSFGADGELLYPSLDPALRRPGVEDEFKRGVLGDVILVNGRPWPFLEVDAARHRLRLLNAANARGFALELDPPPPGGPAFVQVGSDGGLLAAPVAHDRVELAQAERCDVIVDFGRYRPGTRVTLRNRFGDGPAGDVMQFRVVRRVRDDSAVPARLSEIEPLAEADATVRRELRFSRGDGGAWVINGERFDPDRADVSPRLGATEVWEVRANVHHPFHLHLVPFQVLGRGRDGPPGPYDGGWKDTVALGPGDRVRIIMRFAGYRGRYVFHCHNLEHEDMAMMANVDVV